MVSKHLYASLPPQLQTDATLTQASPGDNILYTILETTNVRILGVRVKCVWTGQPAMALRITIDGILYTFYVGSPLSNTYYVPIFDSSKDRTSQALDTTHDDNSRAFFVEARTIKVEASRSAGTVSQLAGDVKYQKF